jgi:hypothetical protein
VRDGSLEALSEGVLGRLVNSVPLSLTIAPGRPRRPISACISRTTLLPEGGVGDRGQALFGDVVDQRKQRNPKSTLPSLIPL